MKCQPATAQQPTTPPQPAAGDVWLLVLRDMEDRRQFGIAKYGKPVHPHNGRDALNDLKEELLDGLVYLRQYQEEMKCLGRELKDLLAVLVQAQSHGREETADPVPLLKSIIQRNPALNA